jgi:hypothetical protein
MDARLYSMSKRSLALILIGIALAGATLVALAQRRLADCAYVPLLGEELLPNPTLAPDPASPRQAAGWGFATSSGVELQHPSQQRGFDLDNDDRALQLIGIANYVETPAIAVQPGRSYCFHGFALTDQAGKGATRAQVVFRWLDDAGAELELAAGDWQPVALWQPGATGWSPLRATFQAPPGAVQLRVRVRPAADNRLYLDAMHVRRTTKDGGPTTIASTAQPVVAGPLPLVVAPWPNGAAAALSFSFDWETTMGGLIHSRSLVGDDLNNAEDPRIRGLRMRAGITTTLELFQAHDIRATYYATGYNFLGGNVERRTFLGNPTFGWATIENGWRRDWSRAPWFGTDPHGTITSDPDYYFGDLLAGLRRASHDIQTHTFGHLYGGYASAAEWRADLDAWRLVAAADQVAAPRSLAFPWSSSAGMSDANWSELTAAGITSVTRTNWSQDSYRLADRDSWQCRPVPAHETILACPDFYLIAGRDTPASARIAQLHAGGGRDDAIREIDRALAAGGMIDIWAHTEEVTSPEQIADWTAVARHAAQARDASRLWIAPLAEIASWQQAVGEVRVESSDSKAADSHSLTFSLINGSDQDLKGLTLNLPFDMERYRLDNQELKTEKPKLKTLVVDIQAGQTVEVQVWPA